MKNKFSQEKGWKNKELDSIADIGDCTNLQI